MEVYTDFVRRTIRLMFYEESVAEAKKQLGNNAIIIPGDAVIPATAAEAINTCIERFGSFNGLYHVAGGSGRKMGDGPLHELTLEGWNSTMELNLTSLMLSNQAAVNSPDGRGRSRDGN